MLDLREYDDLHAVAMLRKLVHKWWKLELAFSDASGYVLDHADGTVVPPANGFCVKTLNTKEGFRRCNESVKAAGDRLQAGRRSVIVRQCHLGFDLVAAPIFFGEKLAGFLFVGGAMHTEPRVVERTELFQKVRDFAGASQEEMTEDFDQVLRMSDAELRQLGQMLEYAAGEIMSVHEERYGTIEPVPADGESTVVAVTKSFGDIVGAAPAMHTLFALLQKIVKSQATVLIHGESGTGKELIARAIHFHGPRAKKPFVVQNCSAFNDNLLESALFGHCRGSFTGAVKDQKGLFETADGGTFFLDEIGDMSPSLQVKLLRVLQEGTLTPLGATKPVRVDVRILAASHKDLTQLIETKLFREDLYYRINVLNVSVPPLRERLEDLPMLVTHFLAKHYHGDGDPPTLAPETLRALASYAWPGNIRELENEIERMNVLASNTHPISVGLLSPRVQDAISASARAEPKTRVAQSGKTATLRELVENVESEVIHQGLIRTHWNKSQLAKELGISRSNLIQKCSYYGLEQKS